VIHAVIDTNVLVSALISPAGNEALLVMAINQGLVVPCFSEEILKEYSGVLLRERFGFAAESISALLDLLRRQGDLIDAPPLTGVSPDPEDDKFIACAAAGKADFLVTGNKRHFPKSQHAGATVVNAGELLAFITLEL
jgi:putative PIN family toxin of toxin-antitoxin system